VPLDWRVMAFTTSVAIATALLFGVLPSLRAARAAPIDALKDSVRGAAGESRVGWSGGLVVGQVALSLVLVTATGLFLRSFVRLATAPIGFDADRVLLVQRQHIAHAHRGGRSVARHHAIDGRHRGDNASSARSRAAMSLSTSPLCPK
jgi:hypothetical protein